MRNIIKTMAHGSLIQSLATKRSSIIVVVLIIPALSKKCKDLVKTGQAVFVLKAIHPIKSRAERIRAEALWLPVSVDQSGVLLLVKRKMQMKKLRQCSR